MGGPSPGQEPALRQGIPREPGQKMLGRPSPALPVPVAHTAVSQAPSALGGILRDALSPTLPSCHVCAQNKETQAPQTQNMKLS